MDTVWNSVVLHDLGIVRARGVEAASFLQGQLSSDLTQLSAQRAQLAGYHNPQGRVIALLRLIHFDSNDILAVLPRELCAPVSARLSKFVLRAKARVNDDSANWKVSGLLQVAPQVSHRPAPATGAAAAALADIAAETHSQLRVGDSVLVRIADAPSRLLLVEPSGPEPQAPPDPGMQLTWRLGEVAAGQPQVLAATSEEFVAQMLNLDVLGAIAFDKGCYTGQEVIARAHYRGRVKRRMQRFVSRGACQLAPGDSAQLEDGRTFKIVLAGQLPDGRSDFLAVTGAHPVTGALEPSREPAQVEGSAQVSDSPVLRVVEADPAPLPYTLPD